MLGNFFVLNSNLSKDVTISYNHDKKLLNMGEVCGCGCLGNEGMFALFLG